MKKLVAVAVFGLVAGVGLGAGRLLTSAFEPRTPDAAAVMTRVLEVARLETLDVLLYKKISFAPEPTATGSLWGDVTTWARYALRAPRGKAIVFAEAHLGIDLDRLAPDSLWIDGRNVYIALPPVRVSVELKPGETEIIDSTLDSAQTAQLFELARAAFERQVEADPALRDRARGAAERAVRGLLKELGFAAVHFVDQPPGPRS